jgi:hypothetical protein
MTKGQIAYRKFLKSDFWKDLSSEKKRRSGGCEECGSTENLEAHHTSYPKNWYDTTLQHLIVLCSRHHMEAHGLLWRRLSRVFPYREDERFNRFIHWAGYLRIRTIMRGVGLKPREVRYLRRSLLIFPPKVGDRAMEYHALKALNEEAV